MIRFENLTIEYGTRALIKNFNGVIESGQCIGVLGPNGAGKSTLLRAILGLVPASQGQILLFNNKAVRGDHRIGYLPQSRHIFLNNKLNGRARLSACLTGTRFGIPWISTKQKKHLSALIELVDANAYVDRPFAELSGGERQRLLLAQSLLNQPKILLLDEPLAGLDIKHQYRLVEIIQRIQAIQPITVLITAHDINPLLPAINKVIYLAGGHCAMGNVKEVINSKTLSQLYGTTVDVIEYDQHLIVYNCATETTN